MSAPLSTALAIARTYLNDDNAIQFPDAVLIPKLQEAHRELQEALWVCGSPVVRKQSAPLNYNSGDINLIGGLPTDLLCPTMLFDNAAGSTIASLGWSPLTEAFYIPLNTASAATLSYWIWQQESITLSPASANRVVIIYYRRAIPIPALTTDLIGILFGESYLGPRGAALAAGTLGSAEALAAMTAVAKENLGNVITANRGQQKPSLRP